MNKIVIFNGSPRSDGNTITLLDLMAKGARDAGAEVEFYILFKMKFMACQGCFGCRTQNACMIEDELSEALQKVIAADAIVVGSPIYHMQMTGPVKNLYDRLFPLADVDFDPHITYKPRFAPKEIVTVYSQGDPDPSTFQSYFDYTAGTLFPAFGLVLVDNLVCTRAWDPAAVERDAALKIRAYEVGKRLALGR